MDGMGRDMEGISFELCLLMGWEETRKAFYLNFFPIDLMGRDKEVISLI
jgi:hypothetical protein